MGKKSKTNALGIVFAALILVGLVLAVVGMVIGNINYTLGNETKSITLFDEMWSKAGDANSLFGSITGSDLDLPQPTFLIVSFIITLVGAAVLVVDAILRLALKKDIKLLRLIGAAVTLIGAVLVLIAGLVLVGNLNSYYADLNEAANKLGSLVGKDLEVKPYSAGAGVWLGFIGGLVAAVAGGLSMLKAFNK